MIIGAAYVCPGLALAQSGKSNSATTSQAAQSHSSGTARSQSPTSIGVAEMQPDGSIDLYLKTEPGQLEMNNGSVGSMRMTSKPGDSDYQQWIKQVGGLKVGERKSIPPLGSDFSTSSGSSKVTSKPAKPAKASKTH
jgi:hypothetical protein